MKNLSKGLLSLGMMILSIFIFVGCSQQPKEPQQPQFEEEVKEIIAKTTSGTVATPEENEQGETVLVCTDSTGGKYIFTETNVMERAAESIPSVQGGVWQFIVDNVILYSGTYEGDIKSEDAIKNLVLTVEKAADSKGELKQTKEERTFTFAIETVEDEVVFEATIPTVEIKELVSTEEAEKHLIEFLTKYEGEYFDYTGNKITISAKNKAITYTGYVLPEGSNNSKDKVLKNYTVPVKKESKDSLITEEFTFTSIGFNSENETNYNKTTTETINIKFIESDIMYVESSSGTIYWYFTNIKKEQQNLNGSWKLNEREQLNIYDDKCVLVQDGQEILNASITFEEFNDYTYCIYGLDINNFFHFFQGVFSKSGKLVGWYNYNSYNNCIMTKISD